MVKDKVKFNFTSSLLEVNKGLSSPPISIIYYIIMVLYNIYTILYNNGIIQL